ncbi:hypothetical protein H4219_004076 [Mycoemilia scoparia]|uniref:AAA-ATPase-like domain-containing protein n=1 Tax=Mycoemilia scoparia TaxID=417184 RepID=A0A9W7ZX86_9FUNG|nr:hypothetical protein H4219_004076 [Mycoemilia scoparia]
MSSGISSIFSLKRSYAIKRKHINDKSGHSDKSILPEIIRDYTEKDVFGMTVNSLRSDWLEMMERREFYIDKTLLIKYEDLSEESLPMVFSHPAGFGKSLYLSMLYNFYDCMADSETRNARYTQFMKCKIFRTSRRFFENNFASTPCIYLSFKRSIENPFSCEEDEHYISGIVILETVIDLLEYIYEKKCLIFVDDFDSACGFDKNGGTSTIKRFGEKEKFAQRFFYIQKIRKQASNYKEFR